MRDYFRENDAIRFVFPIDGDCVNVGDGVSERGAVEVTAKVAAPEGHDIIICGEKAEWKDGYYTAKVEVYGHIISDSSINGDVVCHQIIQSGTINGDVRCEGDIKVNELNAQKVTCNNITDCYKLHSTSVECSGNITAVSLNCDSITYNNK